MKVFDLNQFKNAFMTTYPSQCEAILQTATKFYQQFCKQYETDSKVMKVHRYQNLFPCIALYQAMQKQGVDKAEALVFLDHLWSEKAKPNAIQMKHMLSRFGLYKLYPAMFSFVAKQQFGKKAGFHATFYDCGKQHCKFDMTHCLFVDTCKELGCPELVKVFCHVDDINNGDLHPKLIWNRKKFMGNGDELCDFDIFVKKD